VRVDKVVPNIEGDKIEAYVTLRNRTPREQLINGSVIQGVVTDADGVGILLWISTSLKARPRDRRQQSHRAGRRNQSAAVGAHRSGHRAPQNDDAVERDSQPQTVDISAIQPPGLKPPANFGALNLQRWHE
jgi:hypothetical protein